MENFTIFSGYGCDRTKRSPSTFFFHSNNTKSPMTRHLCAYVALFLLSPALTAQYTTVTYEPERNLLNDGRPLPAETRWMLTGPVSDRMGIVELRVYERADQKHLVHTGRWERPERNTEQRFIIPVDKALYGNEEYTLVLEFFEPVPPEVTAAVRAELERYLSAYVDECFEVGRRRARLLKPVGEVMEDMTLIMQRGMADYRSRLARPFPGFSQLVEDKLRKVNDTGLSLARFSIKSSEAANERDKRITFAREEIAAIKQIVISEVASYMGREWMVLKDRATITDRPTEKVKHIVALNVGYGGIYNSGGLEDLSYSDAPYLGISFPLGRRAMASRFASNSSLSAGVFLTNAKDDMGQEVTGPLVGRPLYAAYGYRIFRLLRLNAGVAVLQSTADEVTDLDINKVYLDPFIGISLEINFWLGLDR